MASLAETVLRCEVGVDAICPVVRYNPHFKFHIGPVSEDTVWANSCSVVSGPETTVPALGDVNACGLAPEGSLMAEM